MRVSVLVVDDDPDYVSTTTALLRLSGFRAAGAGSGADALCRATEQAPDVILLDLSMPDMDGYELADRLRKSRAEKPPYFVAVSGYGRDEDKARSSRAGFDLHLVKPVLPADLISVLAKFESAALV